MKSLKNKLDSLMDVGLEPYQEGKRNFKNPDPDVELLAKRRAEQSKEFLIDEPIDFLRVEDPRIPELSNKIDKRCGCTAAYLFRQNIKISPEWKDKPNTP